MEVRYSIVQVYFLDVTLVLDIEYPYIFAKGLYDVDLAEADKANVLLRGFFLPPYRNILTTESVYLQHSSDPQCVCK